MVRSLKMSIDDLPNLHYLSSIDMHFKTAPSLAFLQWSIISAALGEAQFPFSVSNLEGTTRQCKFDSLACLVCGQFYVFLSVN